MVMGLLSYLVVAEMGGLGYRMEYGTRSVGFSDSMHSRWRFVYRLGYTMFQRVSLICR